MSATASTVTYIRDPDGNLVKVRRAVEGASPRASTLKPSATPPPTSSRAKPSTMRPVPSAPKASEGASTPAAPPKPRRAMRRRADPGWTLPIPPPVRAVAESVAARYGVSVQAILSGERFRDALRARHECWRLVRDTWDLSYVETGRLVGGVDHTSIMSALRGKSSVPAVAERPVERRSKKASPRNASRRP